MYHVVCVYHHVVIHHIFILVYCLICYKKGKCIHGYVSLLVVDDGARE